MIILFQKNIIKSSILIILCSIIILFFIKPIKITGSSMEPTLNHNSWVIINKLPYIISKPKRGDIIIFTLPNSEDSYMIKRIIAIENDIIQVVNGIIYINESLLQEKYIKNNPNSNFPKKLVPSNSVFVLGDNRIISKDSRYEDIGFIDLENIIGKIIYW